jgi:hypothetical protein
VVLVEHEVFVWEYSKLNFELENVIHCPVGEFKFQHFSPFLASVWGNFM